MGLDVPELDDKDYEELLESARQLIPAYSEEWTDHNPQDPGIAVLEVLAWVTETYTYQLDQVTDDHREKYLALLGERPRPPEPATTAVAVERPDGWTGDRIPAGERLSVVDGSGEDRQFETAAPVTLTGATVAAVVTETPAGSTDHTEANATEGMFYRPFGRDPEAGSAVYVGFDGDPFEDADRFVLAVDYHDDDLPPATGPRDRNAAGRRDDRPSSSGRDDGDWLLDPSVELAWEHLVDPENWRNDDAWEELAVLADDTNDLYGGGRVTLERPDGWVPGDEAAAEVVGHESGHSWIRCRVQRGGYEVPPQVDELATNVVPVEHRATVEDERLERVPPDEPPSGLDGQAYRFRHAPVLEATVTVDGERWTAVEDFDASGPTDRHYVLDRVEGVVRFGDGRNGKIPHRDAPVVARQYVFGGGDAGNVPATSSWQFEDGARTADGRPLSEPSVTPRRAAEGGADAETLDAAFRRVRRGLDRPERAVTEDDLAALATATPGCRFGRATVRRGPATAAVDTGRANDGPSNSSGLEGTDATPRPRESRVVVVPYAPSDAPRPEPSEGFRRAVAEHLDGHRLLTDRVTVTEPTYVDLEFEIAVVSNRRRPAPAMESRLESLLAEYVDPLRGYEGDGWPFGRTLYVTEVADVVAGIDWVDDVRSVSLRAGGEGHLDAEGNVAVDPASLFSVADVTVSARTPGTATDATQPGGSTAGPDGSGDRESRNGSSRSGGVPGTDSRGPGGPGDRPGSRTGNGGERR